MPAPPTGVANLAATIDSIPKNIPRALGPSLEAAVDAAMTTIRYAASKGARVSVLVTDSVGDTVVLLCADGASARSQLIARSKANVTLKYRAPSGEVEIRAQTDPKLLVEASADPDIGMLRAGAYPVWENGEMIAVVSVSGALGMAGVDDECGRIGAEALAEHRATKMP